METKENLPAKSVFYHQASTLSEGASSLRNFLNIMFRQKVYIVGFFVFTFVTVAIFTFLSPKIYQSDAKIFIKLGRENISVDPSVVGPTASVRFDRESGLKSEVAALKSRILAEMTVAQIGPDKVLYGDDVASTRGPDSRPNSFIKNLLIKYGLKSSIPLSDVATDKVMQDLSIEVEDDSQVIVLSYQAVSPGLARDLLNVLIDQYRDQHIEMHSAQAPLQFIEKNAENLRINLEQKESTLKEFQANNAISALTAQKSEALKQVSLLQKEIDQVASMIGASSAKIESIQKSLQGHTASR